MLVSPLRTATSGGIAIEPSLRPKSPENGNMSCVGRRLSAIWPSESAMGMGDRT
jgi:hypothetical protein